MDLMIAFYLDHGPTAIIVVHQKIGEIFMHCLIEGIDVTDEKIGFAVGDI